MKNIKANENFLSEMKDFVTFIRDSTKRLEIFRNIQVQGDGEDSDDDEIHAKSRKPTTIKFFCVTRVCVRVKLLNSIRDNYKEIIIFFDKIGKGEF